MSRLPLLLAMLALLPAAPAAAAGGASCTISTTPLAFGPYVPFSNAPSDFTATITLSCTVSGAAPVALHGTIALAGAGGPSGRHLADGAHQLRYQLYLDPARTVPWGDGSGGSGTATVSDLVSAGTPYRQAFTVYGRILARQAGVMVGHYADQITVILEY